MSTYTKPTISNYNDNPPTNDGSANFVDNGVDWNLHIDEIGDPLKNFEESEADATESAFSDLQDINAINVKDPDYGATGDGTTDDSTAIQLAISAAEAAPGATIIFPTGQYNLGTTGIVILGDGIVLTGMSPSCDVLGAKSPNIFGTELLYSGTGTAVAFGDDSEQLSRNGINNLQIKATGAATSATNGIGLKLTNQLYFHSQEVTVKDFESGVGLRLTAAGSGLYGALNVFYGFIAHLCKIGIQGTGTDLTNKDNVATFFGGTTLCDLSSGTIGVDLQEFTEGFTFYGLDMESAEFGAKIDGRSTRFFSTSSEGNTDTAFKITANAINTFVMGHNFISTVLLADKFDDAGTGTVMLTTPTGFMNPPSFFPSADKQSVFIINKADNSTAMVGVSSDASNPRLELVNGTELLAYSDNYTTLKIRFITSVGTVLAENFTGRGTPYAVNTGEINIGGDVSGTASAGSATLPSNPLGFITAFVGSTEVKIPYYG